MILRRRQSHDDVDCIDFVELITDYLEDVVPADVRRRIDEHLEACPGCATALAQWKTVIDMSGHLAETDVEALDTATRAVLLDAFRQGGNPGAPVDRG
jgi:anti-sigma factor RsiW